METADQTNTLTMPAATTALVIFGLDEQNKPHASAFDASEADRAQKAASLMGMTCLHPRSEEEHALAAQLTRGRIFASGKAFVPFVASGIFERIRALAGQAATSLTEAQEIERSASPSPDDAVAVPTTVVATSEVASGGQRLRFGVGSLVLACEGEEDAFWEARILKIDRDDVATLVWEFWPAEAKFKRRITQLSVMPQEKPFW